MSQEILREFSKEQLCDLVSMMAKNWLALDGVWFQSIERTFGMEEAMYHDGQAWIRYTRIEARRIKQFLNLPERPGLDGLEQALALRFYAHLNQDQVIREEGKLIYRMNVCRVQTARRRKGMPYHPCKPVGLEEYAGFADEIDDRITCKCLSCYPDVTDESCGCAWEFTLEE